MTNIHIYVILKKKKSNYVYVQSAISSRQLNFLFLPSLSFSPKYFLRLHIFWIYIFQIENIFTKIIMYVHKIVIGRIKKVEIVLMHRHILVKFPLVVKPYNIGNKHLIKFAQVTRIHKRKHGYPKCHRVTL